MLFNSLSFLLFFPAVTLVYFLIPQKTRYIWALVCSYFFYMCWNPRYALLILLSTAITYFSGLFLESIPQNPRVRHPLFYKRAAVAVSFSSNLLILMFFKYFDFLFDNLQRVLAPLHITLVQPAFDIMLPVGISFYTFQALSYTVDIYRGEIPAERNFLKYALFVSFFPQLVAGPIERSKNLLHQISEPHPLDCDRIRRGLLRMLWGFFLKIVIADRAALLVNQVFDHYMDYHGFQILLAAVLFAVQIYGDFSGYSSIAIGAADVMGYRLMENFQCPYFAASVQDFWRRWHISLSLWFRDYLYIPLGGNRKGRARKYLNLLITFLASGAWHGASWNYIVWGALHGVYQIVGDWSLPLRDRLKKRFGVRTHCFSYRLFQSLTTFALVDFGWIFFRCRGTREALAVISRMLRLNNPGIFFNEQLFKMGLDARNFIFLTAAVVLLFLVSLITEWKGGFFDWLTRQNAWFRWGFYWTVNLLILFSTNLSSQEFVYFQF